MRFSLIFIIIAIAVLWEVQGRSYRYGRKYSCSYGGFRYEHRQIWLSEMCNRRYFCYFGISSPRFHRCPANSICSGRACICNPLYETANRDQNIVTMCRRKAPPRNRVCNYAGKTRPHGSIFLANNCRTRYKCNNGRFSGNSYTCPKNSACIGNRGVCACNEHYETASVNQGLIQSCKIEQGHCTDKGRLVIEGTTWLSSQCQTKYTCVQGEIKQVNYSCPADTLCKLGGQCECFENHEVAERSSGGLVVKCKPTNEIICRRGFVKSQGKCLSFHRYVKINYYDAYQNCRDKGGHLFAASDLVGYYYKFQQDGLLKGRTLFIGSAPEIAIANWNSIRGVFTQKFVITIMERFKTSLTNRANLLARFAANPSISDLNNRSPFYGYCLAYDFVNDNWPTIIQCTSKIGYICEQDPDSGDNIKWSPFYNLQFSKSGDFESLSKVLEILNNGKHAINFRLCRKPVATECRDVKSQRSYNQDLKYGLEFRGACINNRIDCVNEDQTGGRTCPDFEIRFKCRVNVADSCSVDEIKENCRAQNKECVDRSYGSDCLFERREKTDQERIGQDVCFLNSEEIPLHVCRASGDPHYTTLDGYRYNFMGECSYSFVSTKGSYTPTDTFPAFSVVVKNYKKEKHNRVSWTKSFKLSIRSTTYTFTQGKFFVTNGVTLEANVIDFSDDQIKIKAEPKGAYIKLIIETRFCLRFIWDQIHALFVYVPEHYRTNVDGLCGNFDNVRDNDLLQHGTDRKMTPTEIGNNFLVRGPDNDRCNRIVTTPVACSEEDIMKFQKPEYCGVFDVTGDSPLVNAVLDGSDESSLTNNIEALENELHECISDLCWDPSTRRCHDIEDSVEEIKLKLRLYDQYLEDAWRCFAECKTTELTTCANRTNFVFSAQYKRNCENTCKEPDKSATCDDGTVTSGCVCDEGYYLDSKLDCVSLEVCDKSCTLDLEASEGVISLNDGDIHVISPCKKIVRCNKGELIYEELEPCSKHADCLTHGKKCQCHRGYIGDGHKCVNDRLCRHGFYSYGDKCYRFLPQHVDWHSAAINCGRDGSHLARYDDDSNDVLATFMFNLPNIYLTEKAERQTIYCEPEAACKLPDNTVGLSVRIRKVIDGTICDGKYRLSDDKKSVMVNDTCKAEFVVTFKKDNAKIKPSDFKVWIGGNSLVISQTKRQDENPFQIDPPRKVEFSSYQNPIGCFEATLNKDNELIISPYPDCLYKQSYICEYENIGIQPYDPLDFKVINHKCTYEEAVKWCRYDHRSLAIITKGNEIKRVQQLLSQDHLRDDGWLDAQYNKAEKKFQWSDNTPLNFTHWKIGEPSNSSTTKLGQTGDEKYCMAMGKTGLWYTEKCNEKHYPICGPSYDVEPVAYTTYFPVIQFRSLIQLRRKLSRRGDQTYVCERPFNIECSAVDPITELWVTNHDQKGRAITCTSNYLTCERNQGLDCHTFRVRFLCPAEENQCQSLAQINVVPCDNGQLCLPVRNHYLCRCPEGLNFNEKTRTCSDPCGKCTAWGDPHYTTFYGKRYDFMGDCMYKFTGMCNLPEYETEPNFDVYTKNRRCNPKSKAACLEYIEIHLNNIPITSGMKKFKQNFVITVPRSTYNYKLNGKALYQSEFEIKGAFKLTRRYDFFTLYSDILDTKILVSGSKVMATVPKNSWGKMCGLCGDCSSDQFRLQNGTMLTVPLIGKNKIKYDRKLIIPMATDWAVHFGVEDSVAYLKRCRSVQPLEDCTGEKRARYEHSSWCGIFKDNSSSLGPCFSSVDIEQYYEDCIVDSCNDDPETSLCNAIKAYTQLCALKNTTVTWRTESFCPYDCGNKVYRADASCQPTCGRDVETGYACNEQPEEGCVCPTGLLRRGDDCVPIEECGCDVAVNEMGYNWHLHPGKSLILPGCLEKIYCVHVENGTSETLLEPFSMDSNAVCNNGPPVYVECKAGYDLQSDGLTCRRNPKECTRGYINKSCMCIKYINFKKIWRQAIAVCNEEDGTLPLIDTNDKLSEIKEILKAKKYGQILITGQVRVTVDDRDSVSFQPLLGYHLTKTIQYRNFHVATPVSSEIKLGSNINVDDIRREDTVLALAVKYNEIEDSVEVIAVPRDSPNAFICEERDLTDNQTEWYGPYNSDSKLDDGDKETKDSLLTYLVCHLPYAIRCSAVPNATGSVTGKCKMSHTGTYYYCLQGTDCIDHEISTQCAKDADECLDQIDDCPVRTTCVNTIGAYNCRCNNEFPFMINGQCSAIKTCTVGGPETSYDYVYDITGFSNSRGYFDYTCQYLIGGVCTDKYDPESGLPFVQFYFTGEQTLLGLEQKISGFVLYPKLNTSIVWTVDNKLLAEKKILFGHNTMATKQVILGYKHSNMFFMNPAHDVFSFYHEEKMFKATISFPLRITLEFADIYSDMLCGACTLKPQSNGDYIILNDEQIKEISANPDDLCARYTPPPETTTAVSTTTASTTTTTTTPEAPVTTEDICQMRSTCKALSSLCSTPVESCIQSVCGNGLSICQYLLLLSVNGSGGCVDGDRMMQFIEDIDCTEQFCDEYTHFAHTIRTQPICSSPIREPFDSSRPENIFSCVCNPGRLLSSGKCVPENECGCLDEEDGTYHEIGDTWNNMDCTKSYFCRGGFILDTVEMKCNNKAECISSDNGYICHCKLGYYGNGEAENGCSTGEQDETGTQLCYDYIDESESTKRKCLCNYGFVSNCSSCVDLDECSEGANLCDKISQKCVNLLGTYRCECAEGFRLVEGQCKRTFTRRLCDENEPYEVSIEIVAMSAMPGTVCQNQTITVKSCENLSCGKGIRSCCTAGRSNPVNVFLDCFDAETKIKVDTVKKVHYEALKCQCTDLLSDNALDDPFGGGFSGGGRHQTSDPFGGSNSNPFGGGGGSDPFGRSGGGSDPFGGSGGGSDPFGGGGGGNDPFGGSSGGSNPFGGGADGSDPFGGGSGFFRK